MVVTALTSTDSTEMAVVLIRFASVGLRRMSKSVETIAVRWSVRRFRRTSHTGNTHRPRVGSRGLTASGLLAKGDQGMASCFFERCPTVSGLSSRRSVIFV